MSQTDLEPQESRLQLEKKIQEKYDAGFVIQLKAVSYYLARVGLTVDEACRMARVDPAEMKRQIKSDKLLRELISLKELEYKAALQKTVSLKAQEGDDKLATWLLQNRYPGEFNPKKGSGIDGARDADLVGMAIEFIQKSGDSAPLIKETAGRAFLFKKNSQEDAVKSVKDILQ